MFLRARTSSLQCWCALPRHDFERAAIHANLVDAPSPCTHTQFGSWDRNGNGCVDLEEFKRNILDLGLEASDKDIADLFRQLDGDNSVSLAPLTLSKLHA